MPLIKNINKKLMADFTIKARVLSHLDGEGVQVIEHHMVRFWEQRWVTLMMNRTFILCSEQPSRASWLTEGLTEIPVSLLSSTCSR